MDLASNMKMVRGEVIPSGFPDQLLENEDVMYEEEIEAEPMPVECLTDQLEEEVKPEKAETRKESPELFAGDTEIQKSADNDSSEEKEGEVNKGQMPLKVRVKQERQLATKTRGRAKNLTCQECNETFGNWAKLREHYESHEKEENKNKETNPSVRRSKRKGGLSATRGLQDIIDAIKELEGDEEIADIPPQKRKRKTGPKPKAKAEEEEGTVDVVTTDGSPSEGPKRRGRGRNKRRFIHCPKCKLTMHDTQQVDLHVQECPGPDGFKCKYCQRKFFNEKKVQAHTQNVHRTIINTLKNWKQTANPLTGEPQYSKLFKCDFCDHRFLTHGLMVVHERHAHFIDCTLCGEKVANPQILKMHETQEHGIQHPEPIELLDPDNPHRFRIEVVGNFDLPPREPRYPSPPQLELPPNDPRDLFECAYCSQRFPNLGLAMVHERSFHSGQRPKKKKR